MYDFLEGQVASRRAASLTLNVGGIGFELRVPLGVPMPPPGERARLYTHLAVREDAHTLYGFPDLETRDLFRLLLKVRGVGPGMALAVLSGLTRDEFLEAVLRDDAKTLQGIKGVGKKTAEQILLDLKDRAEAFAAHSPASTGRPATGGGQAPAGNVEDAIMALVSIGYSEKDARTRVQKAAESVDPDDLEALVRLAIG
ncbi:MAG: Holliday junction branch migration protein RuvA [Planctomycetota bacterium]